MTTAQGKERGTFMTASSPTKPCKTVCTSNHSGGAKFTHRRPKTCQANPTAEAPRRIDRGNYPLRSAVRGAARAGEGARNQASGGPAGRRAVYIAFLTIVGSCEPDSTIQIYIHRQDPDHGALRGAYGLSMLSWSLGTLAWGHRRGRQLRC